MITVRGRALLERADRIIYAGSLVNPALLDYARAGCDIYITYFAKELARCIKEGKIG